MTSYFRRVVVIPECSIVAMSIEGFKYFYYVQIIINIPKINRSCFILILVDWNHLNFISTGILMTHFSVLEVSERLANIPQTSYA